MTVTAVYPGADSRTVADAALMMNVCAGPDERDPFSLPAMGSYEAGLGTVELAVDNTVNTMPEKTMEAVFDHGVIPKDSIRQRYSDAEQVMASLAAVGIDYEDVTNLLEVEGVDKFTRTGHDEQPVASGCECDVVDEVDGLVDSSDSWEEE